MIPFFDVIENNAFFPNKKHKTGTDLPCNPAIVHKTGTDLPCNPM